MEGAVAPLARGLARAGVSPDLITIVGTLVSAGSGLAAARGQLFLAGWIFLAGGSCDLLDGAVARLRGRSGKRGALLDSTLDRVGEMGLFIGLAAWYARQAQPAEAALAAAALAASTLVSYIKARAEGLGLPAPSGLFTRPERVAILALGLVLTPLWTPSALTALAAVAGLSALTALQRFGDAWRGGAD